MVRASSTPVENPDGSSDLWHIDRNGRLPYQLLDCDGDTCRNPIWTPDGRRLIYERGFNMGPGQLPVNQRLFWFDMTSQTTTPVFSDPAVIGANPRLSPDGTWLSYLVPDIALPLIQLYHFPSNSGRQLISETGDNGVFHPTLSTVSFLPTSNSKGKASPPIFSRII
jgi:Tol biopolymer transport system component